MTICVTGIDANDSDVTSQFVNLITAIYPQYSNISIYVIDDTTLQVMLGV